MRVIGYCKLVAAVEEEGCVRLRHGGSKNDKHKQPQTTYGCKVGLKVGSNVGLNVGNMVGSSVS